ncbi:serotransferrin-1-like [Conger conger]|uniref:serotransferrin-1-like n=1 Tax=Conger conger TaxID=82655 RepID=UPI002A599A83|nr:serotransferrin-1-like [Conger conger]
MNTSLQTLLLGCLGLVLPAALTEPVRWCAISVLEKEKCDNLTSIFTNLNCVKREGSVACITAIKDEEADAVTLDGGDIYKAGLPDYDLHPIIAEEYGENSDTCYFAVAVVKRDSGFGFNELKGKKSCHTGLGKSAGWNIPIGTLLAQGQILWNSTQGQTIESAVSDFFSASCVPGAEQGSRLCSLCKGDCSRSQREPYYGYDGAFNCLKDGRGEVAFVKHTTVPEAERADYQLLCRDGSRRDVSDYASCHLARVPAHAVVSRKDAALANDIWNIIGQATEGSPLFSSVGSKNLLFKDSTVGLRKLPRSTDSFTYLGAEYLSIVRAISGDTGSSAVTWCAVGPAEKQKCEQWRTEAGGMLQCKSAASVDECIRNILRREADAMTMDGGDIYSAGGCGLVPVMAEQYNADDCASGGEASAETSSYYAVAVVRKGSGLRWDGLMGRKSCHTGFGRTAGWNVPMGLIHNLTGECDFSKFFSQSCAPGAESGSSLCALCAGEGCQANSEEPYFGYAGAFRCLVEERGEVAFVKHTTVLENTDGQGAPWASGLNSSHYELLCPTGPPTAPITKYLNCHLAKVPAHAVMTRPERREHVIVFLNEQQANFGTNSLAAFKLFQSEGSGNLLFKRSTKCLQTVPVGQNYRSFLGEEYFASVTSLRKCDSTTSELDQACTFHTCQQRA